MFEKIGRREFLRIGALSAVGSFGLGGSQSYASTKAARPDILIVMPDQMRGDCLSVLGHPVVRTECMDGLAKEGVLFRRAYTTVASCIPARYALLTGLYPQTSGVVGFAAKPFSTPTMPEVLGKAGYSTVLVGRNMHQRPESKACGYDKRVLGSTYIANDEYDKFLREAAPESGGIRNLVKDIGVTFNHWQANAWPLADELHPTAWVVEESRKIVRESKGDQPLFLTTSFYAPHPPLFPPKKYFDANLKKELPAPARGDWVDWGALSPEGDGNGHRILLEGEKLRLSQAGYYGLIDQIDDQIGLLVEDFKRRSEKAGRDWVIVVTSDHGEMMGDHGYFRKCEPFEGSANIPFIVCGSRGMGFKKGLRIKQPVCLEDIMPTLLAMAGTKSTSRVDGVDLGGVLRGGSKRIRDWLHFEHSPCYSKDQAYHALTDGRYKYIWRPTDGKEHLFDLEKDPQELCDLSSVQSHAKRVNEWRWRMITRLAKRPEGFSKDGKLVPGCAYRAINKGLI